MPFTDSWRIVQFITNETVTGTGTDQLSRYVAAIIEISERTVTELQYCGVNRTYI